MTSAYLEADTTNDVTSLPPLDSSGTPNLPTYLSATSSEHIIIDILGIVEGTAVSAAPYESEQDGATDEDIRNYVSRLWAEDWDSPEDQMYDTL